MIIGVPKEIKNHEYRVGLLPVHVEQLRAGGHRVIVQAGAGLGSGASDADYRQAGAQIAAGARGVWDRAGMVVKVKEPQKSEFRHLRRDQFVVAYFHYAANPVMTRAVRKSGCIPIAYEMIQTPGGQLPCLTPMSEIAGRMAVHEGAKYLEEPHHGRGLLLAGVPGVAPATVVILGGGVVGLNAAKMAAGLGADVRLLDVNLERLRHLDDILPANVVVLMSNPQNIRDQVREADLLIGAVLIPGARTPELVSEALVKTMKPGAVIVDVGIDQGGCVATVRPTTHDRPTFIRHGVVHYCVTNMPGAVARTSTQALTNATFPYIQILAREGRKALENHPDLRGGWLGITK
ncbi:MAG: alanine dehydrogenase [Verrucomicrobiae bacterium]|nr:alanine dehydrogenase [Verrucomicrobiae bacterium]